MMVGRTWVMGHTTNHDNFGRSNPEPKNGFLVLALVFACAFFSLASLLSSSSLFSVQTFS